MKWLCLFALLGAALFAQAKADPVERATQFVELLAKGHFERATTYFDATVRAALPADKLQDLWKTIQRQAGTFQSQSGARTEERQGYRNVFATCQFANANLDLILSFDKDDRIAGFHIAPTPPPAAAHAEPPATVIDSELTVNGLAGTLTLPASGRGPFSAVVLVHGSGPEDRDETIGPNKPFRDLAWGLAERGIAVLRYDKRKRFPKDFTVREEVIDDAAAAAAVLRKTPNVDPGNVFILGHSLGGMLIPRIAKAEPDARGFIIMAGPTSPLEDTMVEQLQYLGETDPDKAKAAAAKIMSTSAPPGYWLDLRGYSPAIAAKEITRPLLILQGERDYQVTMKQFAVWKRDLAAKKNVTFHSYPDLNHLFVPGEGKSTPQEYATPGHVSERVIGDISGWIKANSMPRGRGVSHGAS